MVIASREAIGTLSLASVLFFTPLIQAEAVDSAREGSAVDSTESVQILPATADLILQAVRDSDAKAVLVNIWATWCIPCRAEFPELIRLYRDYKERGLKVVFVSGDFEAELPQVKKFLAQQGVDFPTYLKAQKDEEFIDAFDPGWSGALPATFIYDRNGRLRQSLLEAASYEKVEQLVLQVLNPFSDEGGSR